MNKTDTYNTLIKTVTSLTESEDNLIANLSNITAAINEQFDFLWVGFYLVDKEKNQLVLGPFQGPLACTRIPYNKGVCGEAWAKNSILNIPDVHAFPGHIACSSLSNSEIVLPISKEGMVVAVLDIDSKNFSDFDFDDELGLKQLVQHVETLF